MAYKKVFGDANLAIAKGDLFRGVVVVARKAEYKFYDSVAATEAHEKGERPQPLTGDEDKGKGLAVLYVRDDLRGKGFDPDKFNPRYAENLETVCVLPPQDFPERMREGVIDVAIGAGYDIQTDASGLSPLELNGDIHNSETRIEAMGVELVRCGYHPIVCLEYKPTVIAAITRRDSGVRFLGDMKNGDVPVVTELKHIGEEFRQREGLPGRMKPAFGGADGQALGGLVPVAFDVVETGGNMRKHQAIGTFVRDDMGEIVRITYSLPFAIARREAYNNGLRPEIEELQERLALGVTEAKNNPYHKDDFTEKYDGLFAEWNVIDRGFD